MQTLRQATVADAICARLDYLASEQAPVTSFTQQRHEQAAVGGQWPRR
jgi:hypothetical protein